MGTLFKLRLATVKKIAGSSFVAIASLLTGFNTVYADYVEITPVYDGFVSGVHLFTIPASTQFDVHGGYDMVGHNFFFSSLVYNSSGVGTNGSGNGVWSDFQAGISDTMNQTSGEYYWIGALYEPNNSFECSTKDCYYFKYNWDNTTKQVTISGDVFVASSTQIISLSPSGNATTST